MRRILLLFLLALPVLPGTALPRIYVEDGRLCDDAGPLFLYGTGTWRVIPDCRYDFQSEHAWYLPYRANFVRIGMIGTDENQASDFCFPWARSSQPGAHDGGNKFDLDAWDERYWERVHGFLRSAEEHKFYVLLQIWDEIILEQADDRYVLNPFNPDNNINLTCGDLPCGNTSALPEFYDVNNAAVAVYRDAYVRRLLQETWQYPNIIYEINNEFSYSGQSAPFEGNWSQWLDHWVSVFDRFEDIHGVDLLLTDMPMGEDYGDHADVFQEYISNPGIDLLDIYKQISTDDLNEIHAEFQRFLQRTDKPIISGRVKAKPDNYPEEINAGLQQFWTVFLSGGQGATFKQQFPDGSDGRFDSDTAVEEIILGIHAFADSVPWWNMVPHDELLVDGHGFLLADPGFCYAAFLPEGGSVTIDLTSSFAQYEGKWYDTERRIFIDETDITGGDILVFRSPFNQNAVLLIERGHLQIRE
jgi:hypothetical protein